MINEVNIYCTEFNNENKMWIDVDGELSLTEVIRIRNFLTSEIERVQKPTAELLQKINGNTSPEINSLK